MTQFSSLVAELLTRELGTDDSTELFTSGRRESAILEAEEQFADLTECLIRQSTIACSNGVAEYNLLSTVSVPGGDFVRMAAQGPEYRLVSSNSTVSGSTQYTDASVFLRTDVERLNREVPGWRDSTGATLPESWYLRVDGGRVFIGLYPPPTIQSSEAGSFMVPYVARPTTSTISSASTVEPFTVGGNARIDLRPYHRALPHYAAHELEKLRKDPEAADRQLQKFLGWVTRYLQDRRSKQGSRVSQSQNYFRRANRASERVTDPRR